MRRLSTRCVAGLAALALSGASLPASAQGGGASGHALHHRTHRAHAVARAAPAPGVDRSQTAAGVFGLGGNPLASEESGVYAGVGKVGSALLGGGELGNAYEDYITHYYYYKYGYCPLGSGYVYYLRRCVGPADLFK